MYQSTKSLLLVFLALVLVGCSGPNLDSLSNDDVVVAFGDSLTEGVGTNEQNSYPSVLSRLTNLEVINAGVSGETTSEGLVRLPEVINEYDPSLIVLLEGGNDILRGHDYKTIESNLDKMIQFALDRNIPVVLIGVPEKRLFSSSAPFYGDLAEKYSLVFDDELIGSLMRSPSMKSDPIHFNKAGYAELAKGIHELLSDHGAFD